MGGALGLALALGAVYYMSAVGGRRPAGDGGSDGPVELAGPLPAVLRAQPAMPGAEPADDEVALTSARLQQVVGVDEPADMDVRLVAVADWEPIAEPRIDELVARIPLTNGDLVSAAQRQQLQAALGECLLAYKLGDAQRILAERLRAPYRILPEATQWHLSLLQRFLRRAGEKLPEDPEQIMRLLVNRHYYGENGSGYRNLFNELSPEGSLIELHQSRQMPQAMHEYLTILLDAKARTLREGMVGHTPSVEYEESPQRVLAGAGALQYADVWLAATDADGNAYTRFRRYYWAPTARTWLPMEMLSLYAGPRKADAFF